MAKELGATFTNFSNTDRNASHVVCTPKSRTVKTLVALVMRRWVVTDEWIKKSYEERKFLPENDYGVLVKDRPFLNKKFWISTPFKDDKKNLRKISYLDVLLDKGGAVCVTDDRRTEADYVIVPNNCEIDYSPAQSVNWNDFLRLITKEFEDKFRSSTNETPEISPEKEKLNQTETEIFKLTPKKDEKKTREVKKTPEKEARKIKEDKKRKIIDEKSKNTASSSDEDSSTSNKKPMATTKRAKRRTVAKH